VDLLLIGLAWLVSSAAFGLFFAAWAVVEIFEVDWSSAIAMVFVVMLELIRRVWRPWFLTGKFPYWKAALDRKGFSARGPQ